MLSGCSSRLRTSAVFASANSLRLLRTRPSASSVSARSGSSRSAASSASTARRHVADRHQPDAEQVVILRDRGYMRASGCSVSTAGIGCLAPAPAARTRSARPPSWARAPAPSSTSPAPRRLLAARLQAGELEIGANGLVALGREPQEPHRLGGVARLLRVRRLLQEHAAVRGTGRPSARQPASVPGRDARPSATARGQRRTSGSRLVSAALRFQLLEHFELLRRQLASAQAADTPARAGSGRSHRRGQLRGPLRGARRASGGCAARQQDLAEQISRVRVVGHGARALCAAPSAPRRACRPDRAPSRACGAPARRRGATRSSARSASRPPRRWPCLR